MPDFRLLPLLALALAGVPAAAQTSLQFYADELLSRNAPALGPARHPSISDDGRWVVWEQDQSLILADRQTTPATLTPIPLCDAGDPAPPGFCNFYSFPNERRPRLSGDGRYVLFESQNNLTANPDDLDNDVDLFRYDRETGAVLLVSSSSLGVIGDGASFWGEISRNGRYVTFESRATNLITGMSLAPNRTRVFWKDLQTGQVQVAPDELQFPGLVQQGAPRISANGRFVLYEDLQSAAIKRWDTSNASQLAAGRNDWIDPTAISATRDHFSLSSDGRVAAAVGFGAIERRGSFTASTYAQVGLSHVFAVESQPTFGMAVDLSSGGGFMAHQVCFQSNQLGRARSQVYISAGTRAYYVYLGWGFTETCEEGFDMTPSGEFIVTSAFDLWRPDWCANCFGGVVGNPFHDDNDNANDVVLIRNPLYAPLPKNLAAISGVPADSRQVQVSADGKVVVFESDIPASAFDPGYVDNNGSSDVFRYLVDFDTVELMSTDDEQTAFPGGARNPSMSQDGGMIAFEALDAGITALSFGAPGGKRIRSAAKASLQGIFLRDMLTGNRTLTRASTSRNGGMANGSSMNPRLSPDGRLLSYASDASDVNPDPDSNGVRDVVLLDLLAGTRSCVSQCPGLQSNGDSDLPAVSNNRRVAWRTRSASLQKAAGAPAHKAGLFAQILLRDLLTGRNTQISRSANGQPAQGDSDRPVISSNGGSVGFESTATDISGANGDGRRHVYLYQPATGRMRRISRPPGDTKHQLKLDGDSEQAAISADGRFVTFQSDASQLDDFDSNGVTDIYVYDAHSDQLQRLSDGFGGSQPNGASQTPSISRNGNHIGFQSYASNFADNADDDALAPAAARAPFLRRNPLAARIVHADGFE